LIASGYHVNYTPQSSGIFVDSSILIPFKKVRNLWFLLLVDTVSPMTFVMKLNRPDLKTIIQWHLTFAHASDRVSYETAKILCDLPALPLTEHPQCPICIQSKMRARNHPPLSTSDHFDCSTG
jgi:hypothetical protein